MDKDINCDPCQEQGNITEGIRWCPNCGEKLCNGCASHHRSSKATKSHRLLDINLLTEFPFSISTNRFCDQHCNIQIEYFCTHHDVILCRACLADGHRSCTDVAVLDIGCEGSKTTVLKSSVILLLPLLNDQWLSIFLMLSHFRSDCILCLTMIY
jgi:hypothetical protein